MNAIVLSFILFSAAFAVLLTDDDPHVRAELISSASDFTKPFEIGIYFTLDSSWYLYWKNPGDAGLPVAVTWTLPKGFEASPLEYPTPERIIHGDVLSYGFHRDLLITSRITPPAGYTPRAGDRVTVKLDWLVCSESCIPGGITVSFAIGDQSEHNRRKAERLFSGFTGRMPQPLDALGVTAQPAMFTSGAGGSHLRITFSGAESAAITDFYPEVLEDFVIDHKSITAANETVTIPLTPYSQASIVKELKGLVITGTRGYAVTIPVRKH